MSTGWSLWVMGLVVLNIGITLFLFFWGTRVSIPTENDGTSGHVWAHGVLREGVRKVPVWWYVPSVCVFIISITYLVFYPGFGNNPGKLGWTSYGELEKDVAANNALLDPIMQRAESQSFKSLSQDPQALQIGHRLFQDNCAACHGRDGLGNKVIGAPNLLDGASLFGGSAEDIVKSIRDGRNGVMPGWESLGYGKVKNLAHYIRRLSGESADGPSANAGENYFDTCAACHGADAKGNKALGAPNLTDNASLYGNSIEELMTTINKGRQGYMPAWKDRLSNAEIRVITAWILGNETASAGK